VEARAVQGAADTPEQSPPVRLGRRNLLLIGMATALGSLSIDLYLPAFPELAVYLQTSEAAVQITLTACVIGLAVGQVVAGPLSDAWGRRAPIMVGLLGWGLASLLCALAPSVEALTVLRFAQGLLGAAGLVVSRAVVRDLASGGEMVLAFARLGLIVGLVPILAPTLGGLMLEVMPWQGLFVALAAFGLVGAIAIGVGLVESLPPRRRRPAGLGSALRSYGILLRDISYLRSAMVLSFAFAALFVYVSDSAFVMRNVYDLDASGYGLMFAAHSVMLVAGGQLSGRLAKRVRPSLLLGVALVVALAGSVGVTVEALTGLGGIVGAVGTVVITIFGIGMALPIASSASLANHPDRAGAASALLGLLQFSLGGVIAPVVGALGTTTLLPLALSLVACLLVAIAFQTLGRGRGVARTA
jgi:DHA1 family bicyclomycin/chloramphenicol resistance-like MFS transporter